MRAVSLLAGAIYRAFSRLPRVSRLKSRYASQIEAGGAQMTQRWLARQVQSTSIATCAVALSAPAALIAIAIQPLPELARAIGAGLVCALAYIALSSDTAKILAVYETQQARGDQS